VALVGKFSSRCLFFMQEAVAAPRLKPLPVTLFSFPTLLTSWYRLCSPLLGQSQGQPKVQEERDEKERCCDRNLWALAVSCTCLCRPVSGLCGKSLPPPPDALFPTSGGAEEFRSAQSSTSRCCACDSGSASARRLCPLLPYALCCPSGGGKGGLGPARAAEGATTPPQGRCDARAVCRASSDCRAARWARDPSL